MGMVNQRTPGATSMVVPAVGCLSQGYLSSLIEVHFLVGKENEYTDYRRAERKEMCIGAELGLD